MTTNPARGPGPTIEESNARYKAAMEADVIRSYDPQAADLYSEISEPDPYIYPAGSQREESTLCDQVNDGKSNQVMRKLLADAENVITGERQRDYGLPEINHQRTAGFWSIYLGIKVTPFQVCIMNDLQKTARGMEKVTPDFFVDKVGFVANAAACFAAELPVNGT